VSSTDAFSFTLLKTDGRARRGRLQTPHGEVDTPIFMPVGTVGSVKSLAPDDLLAADARIVLGNTYHLMLRGGFQVFSLAAGKPRGDDKSRPDPGALVKIDDDGVTFRSHLDGSKYRMTPEESMRVQMCIGADIIMAFDQCPPAKSSRDDVRVAMERTTRWLDRCDKAMTREGSRLFGIIQGAIYEDLRTEHAQEICERDLFGFAVGGLSVGEEKDEMLAALGVTTAHMPAHKPRYLMGVGTPDDLLDGVARGVDMFDCVMPTRNARNGMLFTSRGRMHIKNARFSEDTSPVDDACECYTCRTFHRAYLRHLFVAGELLYHRLASLHNITYYLSLMRDARAAIEAGRYAAFHEERKRAHAAGP
jgi:queuine tRNA-ribosyltransferase